MASVFSHFVQGVVGGLDQPTAPGLDGFHRSVLGAVASGVERALHRTEGLSEEDRHWVQRQGSNISQLATGGVNLLSSSARCVYRARRDLGRLTYGFYGQFHGHSEVPRGLLA